MVLCYQPNSASGCWLCGTYTGTPAGQIRCRQLPMWAITLSTSSAEPSRRLHEPCSCSNTSCRGRHTQRNRTWRKHGCEETQTPRDDDDWFSPESLRRLIQVSELMQSWRPFSLLQFKRPTWCRRTHSGQEDSVRVLDTSQACFSFMRKSCQCFTWHTCACSPDVVMCAAM